jgi:hypothetical protein
MPSHLLTRYLPGWRSVFVQLTVMLAAVTLLPLAIAVGWERPPAVGEAFWLIGLFTVSIGLPFFALAANSPLLQAWFAGTRHPAAEDPYFLYAASNMGSLLALVAYPVAFEPFMRLTDQAKLWSVGFYVLIVMIAVCGVLAWRFIDQAVELDFDHIGAAHGHRCYLSFASLEGGGAGGASVSTARVAYDASGLGSCDSSHRLLFE